tara:strand:- start:67 stop:351 length:285 start_codon:yes stop_codon:yes gene_type:complete
MKLNRVEYIFAGDELIETIQHDIDWNTLRKFRKELLERTDVWYFSDRWSSLSTTAKGQLNSYRKLLRDLPQDYPGELANDAVDNFPEPAEWILK